MTRDPFLAFVHGVLVGSALTASVIALLLSFGVGLS